MAIPQHLTNFLTAHPSIKVIHRNDPDFDSTKEVFIDSPDVPLLIARPRTESDIAALVGHLSAQSIPLVVRAGGHDLSARSVAQDAVQIDLRDIAHVRVAEDKTTAFIGGGILTQAVLDGLALENLMAAVGNASTVGWTSWAMNGGYGILSGKYGLGCDQIVGARVVLADGSVIQADERLLKALRGCGPAFGVVAEVQIKVYPLTKIVSGFILYPNADLQGTATTYFNANRALVDSVQELPRELYFQPMMFAAPGQQPGFVIQFVWAAPPSDEQSKWLEKISGLVEGGTLQVGPMFPGEYTRIVTQLIDPHTRGGETRTVSMQGLAASPEAAAVIIKQIGQITGDFGAVFVHGLHGLSIHPGAEHPASVFASREKHMMAEILGFAFRDETKKEPAAAWARATYEELRTAEGALDKAYFPLTQGATFDPESTYNKVELAFLRGLKKELDPKNVFYNGLPLGGS